MRDPLRLKVLIYLCGDAADRLPPHDGDESVNLEALLQQPVPLAGLEDVVWALQVHVPAGRQAVRLVQQPGEERAQVVERVPETDDGPAARDRFVAWAAARYPSQRTLLLLGDCRATPNELQPQAGAVFQVVTAPDGPDQWPMGELVLARVLPSEEDHGSIGVLLGRLMAFLLDNEPIGRRSDREEKGSATT